MAITERLALLIDADAQGAVREMEKVGKTAERELGRTEDRFDKLGKSMQSTGIKMMATSAVLGAGMWKAGQQAADLEQAVGGTEAVFGSAAGAIEDFASRSASSAGLSERAARELTSSLGALLQGFGFTREEAAATSVQLAQLGADLAATFGGAPEEAVAALGAALRGEFDPLERFGVSLNVSQANLKAVEMGLASSTSEVDLNARAQASLALIMERSQAAQGQFGRELDTTSGKLAVTKAEFEDAQAQLGQGFLPVMTSVAGVASDLIGVFVGLDNATGGVASQVAGFGTVALGAAGALSWVVGKGIESRDMFVKGGEAAMRFARNLGMSRTAALATGGALGALGLAIGAGVMLWQQHESAQRAAQDRAESMLGTLDATTGALTEQSGALIASNYAKQIDNLDRAKVSMDELKAAIEDTSLTTKEWDAISGGTVRGSQEHLYITREVIEALRGREDAMSRLIVKMHEAGELDAGEVKMLRDQSAALADARAQREATTGVMGEEAAARQGLAGVTDDQAEAEQEAAEAADVWTVKQGELNDALSEAQTELDKAKKAVLGYFDALDGSVNAEMEFHAALDGLAETLKENGTAWDWTAGRIDITTQKGRENTKAMQDARDAILGMGQQHLEMTGSAQEAASMVGLLTEGLRQQMVQAGYTKAQQDELLASLGLTPEQVVTAYSQPGLQEGLDKTGALRRELESLPAAKEVAVRVHAAIDSVAARLTGSLGAFSGLFGGGRAAGGPVDAGRAYLVGEEGPELVVPRQSGTVIPADRTAAALGGEVVVHSHLYLDSREIVHAIDRDTRSHGGGR